VSLQHHDHWWSVRVPPNLIDPTSAGWTRTSFPLSKSRPGGRPTDRSTHACRVPCGHRSQAEQCPKTEMRRAARMSLKPRLHQQHVAGQHVAGVNAALEAWGQYAPERRCSTQALSYIHDHLINAIGSQKISCLCLLDLSAAFDTIDHNILITRLSSWFGIHGSVLNTGLSLIYHLALSVLNVINVYLPPIPVVFPEVLFLIPYFSLCTPLFSRLYH